MLPLLEGAGLATAADRGALTTYCASWALWRQAHAALQAEGVVLRTRTGYPVLNPWLTVADRALGQMRAFLAEFGMTPASRGRLVVTPPPAPLDPGTAFLQRPRPSP